MKRNLKFSKTVSSQVQFKINTSIIFNYLRKYGPLSRAEISKQLNISAPAVSRVIDKLLKDGYVLETEKIKTKGGKRPIMLEVEKSNGYVIGIDLGKERLKVGFSNFDGEILEKFQSFKIVNKTEITEKIVKEIKKFINLNNKLRNKELKAISIGIPATVDSKEGKIAYVPLYSSWKEISFKKFFKDAFGVPVYIDNDVNLSTLAEKNYGDGKNYNNIVFLEISNGIGTGIVIDNNIFRGSKGSAGEIAYTISGVENLDFKVQNKGFLEKYASVESLKKKAIRGIKKGKESVLTEIVGGKLENIEPYMVVDSAIKGDKLSKDIIGENVDLISMAIINLVLILNPDALIIGGDFCNLPKVAEIFLNPTIKKVETVLPFPPPEIELSKLGEDAGILGASYLAIESEYLKVFPYTIE